ncbi:MAG: HAMP domain-containing histidine kinase [Armatimonadetes bacterium]|nr:HAMP domain-containing histidine kinase [Armatimonadota bacterium]
MGHSERCALDPILGCWLATEPAAAALVGPDGCYRLANQAYAEALGLVSPAGLCGRPRLEVLDQTFCRRLADPQPLLTYLRAADAQNGAELSVCLSDAALTWRYDSLALLGPDGALLGWRERLVPVRDEAEMLRAELERQLAAKDQLLARVSHELRTPLTAIIGFCHMLLGYCGELATRQEAYVQRILKNAQAELQLLNNVLDLARLSGGPLPVLTENVELTGLAAELVETAEALTWDKDVHLVVEAEPVLPVLVTDQLKLRQILLNLLSNAVKFTDHGEVRLTLARGESGVRLAVSDSGVGIPPDQLGRIFLAYVQVEDSRPGRRVEGTGLGLAICSRLARLLGGEITVESELGRGSVFTLHLPLVAPAAPRPE